MMFTPKIRTAAVAACLTLPLWLGSCTVPTGSAGPASSGGTPAQAAGLPEPQPLPTAVPGPPVESLPQSSSGAAEIATPRAGNGSTSSQAGIDGTGTGNAGGPGPGTLGSEGQVLSSRQSGAPSGQAALPGQLPAGLAAGTPVYFVSLDDGGSSGVRFGCNDSLVGVYHAASTAEEPLRTSFRVLLGGGESPEGLYNSLEDSTLEYVSAYFDGTTVVVNMTGSIRPGGTCDIPRVEAQLTHTAVAAVGAARAEIYVDGRSLADVLSLR